MKINSSQHSAWLYGGATNIYPLFVRYSALMPADGLWYFQLTFHGHTQQHILDLLNYMKQKNE